MPDRFLESLLTRPLRAAMNAPPVRRRAIPDRAPRALAEHCTAEYANLASLLPDLHSRYAGG